MIARERREAVVKLGWLAGVQRVWMDVRDHETRCDGCEGGVKVVGVGVTREGGLAGDKELGG